MTGRLLVRRTVFLLIGGAIALAFLILAASLATPLQTDGTVNPRDFTVLALVPMVTVGLLPGVREVQVAAAQTLLGASDVTVPEPMGWTHRWRTALWTFLHQVVGFIAGLALALAVLVVGRAGTLAAGQAELDVVGGVQRPETVGGWVLLVGATLAAVLAAAVLLVGCGMSAAWSAPLLLGSSGADRLAVAERRLRREQEFRRLSRDLHDGVGHALSAISLQAVAGSRVIRQDPEKALAALTSIQALAGDAVAELDQVLGMLREDAAPTHPEPTLTDLPDLIQRHLDMGMPLQAEVPADLDVPGPLSRTAYRVCAEALSNAAKYAGPGPVTLGLSLDDGDLVVGSRNRVGRAVPSKRTGHGLAGLTESVAVFGGRLDAGPVASDWVLSARLPTGDARG
jgi:signal transduction histidine kinase